MDVYRIHDNPITRAWLWPHLAWVYALEPAGILVIGVASGVVVYAIGATIDLVRIAHSEKPLFDWIGRRFRGTLAKANQWMDGLAKINDA